MGLGEGRRFGCFTFIYMVAACLVAAPTVAEMRGSGIARTLAIVFGASGAIGAYIGIEVFQWRIARHFWKENDVHGAGERRAMVAITTLALVYPFLCYGFGKAIVWICIRCL